MHLGWSSNILQLNNRRSDLKLLVGSQRMHRCEPTSNLFFFLYPRFARISRKYSRVTDPAVGSSSRWSVRPQRLFSERTRGRRAGPAAYPGC